MQLKPFKVKILFQKNLGYGDALIKGINNCKTNLFCIFNADGSFKISEILKMKKILNSKKLDFIFGSRYQKNAIAMMIHFNLYWKFFFH